METTARKSEARNTTRIPISQPVSIVAGNLSHPSVVQNASLGGFMIRVEKNLEIPRRATVYVSMVLGRRTVRMPAIVAWSVTNGHATDVGLSLQLGVFGQAIRDAYLLWFSRRAARDGFVDLLL